MKIKLIGDIRQLGTLGLGDWDLGLDNLKVKNTYFQEENKMLTKVNYCGGHSRK